MPKNSDVKKYPCPRCNKPNKIVIEGRYGKLECKPCNLWKTSLQNTTEKTLAHLRGGTEVIHPDWEDKQVAGTRKNPVYGRDLLQPGDPQFAERYGDGIYKGKQSQLDGKGKKKPIPLNPEELL